MTISEHVALSAPTNGTMSKEALSLHDPEPRVRRARVGVIGGARRTSVKSEQRKLETWISFVSTSRAFERGIERRTRACGFTLSRARFMLLCLLYLSPGGGLSQQQIARSLNVTNSNITQLIDALVRDGWIERSVDNADRRVRNAQLTMSGRQRCADLVHDVLDFIDTSAARRR